MTRTPHRAASDTGRNLCYDYACTPLIQRTPGKRIHVAFLLPAVLAALLARFNLPPSVEDVSESPWEVVAMLQRIWFQRLLLLAALLALSSCARDSSLPAGGQTLASTLPAATPIPTSAPPTPSAEPPPPPAGPAEPAIHVQPESALADELVTIQVLGLEPGQTVTLTASLRDDGGAISREWASFAAFTAGGDGVVDLTTQAPITGTYTGVDPMGLLWSMVPDVRGPEYTYFANHETSFKLVTLTATIDEREVGPAYFRRIRLPDTVARTPLSPDVDGLVGDFLSPAGAGPFPALLVLGGSGGGMDTTKAAMLAAHGYATLALAYFGRPPLPDVLAEIPLEYFETAITWLQSQDSVDAEKIGVVGTSRGGELALLLGATYPQLKAVAGYVASGVVAGGYTRSRDDLRPAWTYAGTPVPFATSDDDLDIAAIPVENIQGPVLLISGEDDQFWPSARLSEIAIARIRQNNHPHEYEHLVYEDAGHFIGIPYWPTRGHIYVHPVSGVRYTAGGTPEGNAFASADSWPRVLAFLERAFQ
jgi:dienelactone hydrolase